MTEITRESIVARMVKLRDEIRDYFLDADHWNNSARRADEEPIDPDPDGKLAQLLQSLEQGIRRETIKVVRTENDN